MKRTLAITAIALTAMTGAASAMVSNAAEAQIERFAPSVDVQSLSTLEVNKLLAVINGGGTDSEKRATVQALVK
ncbi:MAG: hypothetical protein QNJ09_02765 [Paracoccaceae bacterium]|nr:hypothetical protein [Paracoccaceae bacterium]